MCATRPKVIVEPKATAIDIVHALDTIADSLAGDGYFVEFEPLDASDENLVNDESSIIQDTDAEPRLVFNHLHPFGHNVETTTPVIQATHESSDLIEN